MKLKKIQITAIIPGPDHFVSIADLDIFNTAKNMYVKDSRGYTGVMAKAFIIQVSFDVNYLRNLGK